MLLSQVSRKNEIGFAILVAFLMLIISLLSFATRSWADNSPVLETQATKKLELTVGKSLVIKTDKALKRVSTADPEVADFILISPQEIYLSGKSAGITNLTLWQGKKIFAIYDLDVSYDVSRLKQRLHEVLPNETDLRVMATHNSITLSGRVSNAANNSQAMAIAHEYAPEGKVQNLVEVGGVHQVMLEVRVSEISRSLLKKLGVNFSVFSDSGNFGISKLASLTELAADGSGTLFSSSVNALFRFTTGNYTWTGFVDALKQDGLLKVLAEPTLIALSGHEASFLAGGEFPVPVPQGLGTVGIEYKSFGVGLSFMPTVLSENRINLKVAPEVSSLDFSNALNLEGYTVPGLTTRRTSTTIELADGQSFAIAGLLKDNVRHVIDKYPFLGDLPILGPLFQSKEFRREETELIIIATPHLVKPLDMKKQPLPTDSYIVPNDTEFYLWNLMEGREEEKGQPSDTSGEMDGDFGHALPE
jgi:pilus assembly protein CpaC